ncbi:hypothetical protein ACVIGB_000779 [Bradyrhizobium sp. USDA 4341]
MSYQLGGNIRTVVRSFSVPPAVNPGIKHTPLCDLSHAFGQAWNGAAMRRYVDAMSAASAEQVELARPQIYYTADNISRRLWDEAFAVTRSVKHTSSPEAMIGEILDGVAKNASQLLTECDNAPRNRIKLRRLAGALSYLAEIRTFCAAIAPSHPAFEQLADISGKAFDRLTFETERFRQDAAGRYPEVAEIIPIAGQFATEAEAALQAMEFTLPRLSRASIDRLLCTIGDHQALWRIASGKDRDKFIAAGHHCPITEREAKEIVSGVRRLAEDFDSLFYKKGFLAELRKCAASFRYQSLESADQSERRDESSIRRERKSPYESTAEHRARVEAALTGLPAQRLRMQKSAAEMQSVANMLSGFLHGVERSLRGKTSEAFIRFRRSNGALVGELDVPGADAIVIYDDHVVRAQGYPEAVYAIRMPADMVAAEAPPLTDVREAMFGQATNYHSLVQCLTELDGETERGYFFAGIRINGHDAFEVLDGAVSLSEEASCPGPRM